MLITEDLPRELTWTDDTGSGITRRRSGRGFSYRTPNGHRVGAADLERIRALAIPPAWTDVWINPSPHGHLQATGRDARGRKQYRYHPDYRAHRELAKFSHLHEFGAALPAIRTRVASDLAQPGVPYDKVVATVVRLLETTFVRVGNEEYARTNQSYGLTTLRDRHAKFSSHGLQLVFKGKHGTSTNVRIQDARLRRVIRQCQDLPGQCLFQYVDADGNPRPISSTDVNAYLRDTTGLEVSAKDFRTWMGTLIATVTLLETQSVPQTMRVVAEALRNTPAVARGSYVHPTIVDWFTNGSLESRWDAASARGSRHLLAEERKLVKLLRDARKPSAARVAA